MLCKAGVGDPVACRKPAHPRDALCYMAFRQAYAIWHAIAIQKSAPPMWAEVMAGMQRVRTRLLQDREEEVKGVAKMIYSERQGRGQQQRQIDGFADWVEAENRVIRSTFERQTGCTLSLTNSLQVFFSSFHHMLVWLESLARYVKSRINLLDP